MIEIMNFCLLIIFNMSTLFKRKSNEIYNIIMSGKNSIKHMCYIDRSLHLQHHYNLVSSDLLNS